jgi:hypothetical protein
MDPKVVQSARDAFAGDAPALTLGAPLHAGECHPECLVRVPLTMMNRHGLIAGATGTGKTKTLQLMAEQLSAQGVPVFLADLKGDLRARARTANRTTASPSGRRAPDTTGDPAPARLSSSA